MEALLPLSLKLLATAAPLLPAGGIGDAIKLLVVAAPAVVQTARDLVPVVKSTIDALRSNGAITPAQLDVLDAVEEKLDADYEAASAAAAAEDRAAAASKAQG